MNNIIVMGVFTNIGYQICCEMLENEIQVIGIDDRPIENSESEDKLLRIGRNAFFQYEELTDEVLQNNRLFDNVDTVFYTLNESRDSILNNVIDLCKLKQITFILMNEEYEETKLKQFLKDNSNSEKLPKIS